MLVGIQRAMPPMPTALYMSHCRRPIEQWRHKFDTGLLTDTWLDGFVWFPTAIKLEAPTIGGHAAELGLVEL